MVFRITILPGGEIELHRPGAPRDGLKFMYFKTGEEKQFFTILYYLIKRELARAHREVFTPALDRECKRLLKLKLTESKDNAYNL